MNVRHYIRLSLDYVCRCTIFLKMVSCGIDCKFAQGYKYIEKKAQKKEDKVT